MGIVAPNLSRNSNVASGPKGDLSEIFAAHKDTSVGDGGRFASIAKEFDTFRVGRLVIDEINGKSIRIGGGIVENFFDGGIPQESIDLIGESGSAIFQSRRRVNNHLIRDSILLPHITKSSNGTFLKSRNEWILCKSLF